MKRCLSLGLFSLLLACSRHPAVSAQGEPAAAPEVLPPEALEAAEAPALANPTPELRTPPTELRAKVEFSPAGEKAVSSVREVTLTVDAIGVAGQRELAVEFIAPGELPYERRAVAVAGTGNELQTLTFGLPVAGTMIHQSRLSGHWEVRLLLDGAAAGSAVFELQP